MLQRILVVLKGLGGLLVLHSLYWKFASGGTRDWARISGLSFGRMRAGVRQGPGGSL
jgi:hypothetical protein